MDENRYSAKRELISLLNELDEIGLWATVDPLGLSVDRTRCPELTDLQAAIKDWGEQAKSLRQRVEAKLARYLEERQGVAVPADVQTRLQAMNKTIGAAGLALIHFLEIADAKPYDLCAAGFEGKARLSPEAFRHYSLKTRYVRLVVGFPSPLQSMVIWFPARLLQEACRAAWGQEKAANVWGQLRILRDGPGPVASALMQVLYEYGGLDWDEIACIESLRFSGVTSDNAFFLHVGASDASSQGLT